jgi:hypothetical protein
LGVRRPGRDQRCRAEEQSRECRACEQSHDRSPPNRPRSKDGTSLNPLL